jgi:hypothetical protein
MLPLGILTRKVDISFHFPVFPAVAALQIYDVHDAYGTRPLHQRAARGQEEKTVVLATFTPPLEPSTFQEEKKKTATEVVMVIDCSGSMVGTPMKQARDAALFFLKDLPVDEGVRVNVMCFGSTHVKMFPSSKPYDTESEQHAVNWISANVNADLTLHLC